MSIANDTSQHCRALPKRNKSRSAPEISRLWRCRIMFWESCGDRKPSFRKRSKHIQPHRICRSNYATPNWDGEFTAGKDKRLQLRRKLTTQLPLIKRRSELLKRRARASPKSGIGPAI